MFFETISERTPQEIRSVLPGILGRHGFILLGVRDLQEIYLKHGHTIGDDLLLFEISNPELGIEAIRALPQCIAFMPFRIAVYIRKGRTRVATLLPVEIAKVLPAVPRWPKERSIRNARTYQRRVRALIRDICRGSNGRKACAE